MDDASPLPSTIEKWSMHISTTVAILSKWPGGDQRARSFTFKDERDTPDMYLYLRNKNVPGFTYLLFVFTQWTFLFQTAETCSKLHKMVSHRKCTEVRIFMRPGWLMNSWTQLVPGQSLDRALFCVDINYILSISWTWQISPSKSVCLINLFQNTYFKHEDKKERIIGLGRAEVRLIFSPGVPCLRPAHVGYFFVLAFSVAFAFLFDFFSKVPLSG